mmetsp:Transcript_40469/g.86338  ORF Transcript_40469/g.86338 Transcript_40469/m.86338 type:complete len:205 (-) Transcript_40469:357-971(-)
MRTRCFQRVPSRCSGEQVDLMPLTTCQPHAAGLGADPTEPSIARRMQLLQRLPGERKHLHTLARALGDQDAPVLTYRNPGRVFELPRRAATFAEASQVRATFKREDAHTVVPGVRHVHLSRGAGDVTRLVELAWSAPLRRPTVCTERLPNVPLKAEAHVEDGDTMVFCLGNEQLVAGNRNCLRILHLTRACAEAASTAAAPPIG